MATEPNNLNEDIFDNMTDQELLDSEDALQIDIGNIEGVDVYHELGGLIVIRSECINADNFTLAPLLISRNFLTIEDSMLTLQGPPGLCLALERKFGGKLEDMQKSFKQNPNLCAENEALFNQLPPDQTISLQRSLMKNREFIESSLHWTFFNPNPETAQRVESFVKGYLRGEPDVGKFCEPSVFDVDEKDKLLLKHPTTHQILPLQGQAAVGKRAQFNLHKNGSGPVKCRLLGDFNERISFPVTFVDSFSLSRFQKHPEGEWMCEVTSFKKGTDRGSMLVRPIFSATPRWKLEKYGIEINGVSLLSPQFYRGMNRHNPPPNENIPEEVLSAVFEAQGAYERALNETGLSSFNRGYCYPNFQIENLELAIEKFGMPDEISFNPGAFQDNLGKIRDEELVFHWNGHDKLNASLLPGAIIKNFPLLFSDKFAQFDILKNEEVTSIIKPAMSELDDDIEKLNILTKMHPFHGFITEVPDSSDCIMTLVLLDLEGIDDTDNPVVRSCRKLFPIDDVPESETSNLEDLAPFSRHMGARHSEDSRFIQRYVANLKKGDHVILEDDRIHTVTLDVPANEIPKELGLEDTSKFDSSKIFYAFVFKRIFNSARESFEAINRFIAGPGSADLSMMSISECMETLVKEVVDFNNKAEDVMSRASQLYEPQETVA